MVPWLRSAADPLPPASRALGADSAAPGLLAAGGSLDPERLREAYGRGIFPWFGVGEPVLWWAPDPRMVLFGAEFRLTRSLRKTLGRFVRTPGCEVRVDSAFADVILACAEAPREGQAGTWIVPEMIAAYRRWHRLGAVHSFETWIDGTLAGGLYGVSIGRMFFGESMFARRADASKIALAALVCFCREHAMPMIDCQQATRHLASLGAREIPRRDFEALMTPRLGEAPPPRWTYDRSWWRHLLPGRMPEPGATEQPTRAP